MIIDTRKGTNTLILAKLEVVIMSNGEIFSAGYHIGYMDKLGKYVSERKDAITGEDITT